MKWFMKFCIEDFFQNVTSQLGKQFEQLNQDIT